MKSKIRYVFVVLFFVDFQSMLAGQNDQSGSENKLTAIHGYVQLAASMVQQGYAFFKKDKVAYDLQQDVLDHAYKKMIYDCIFPIEQLFDNANKHDNPPAQMHAIILLFRMPVPEWYCKNFTKGLDVLYATCFDELGNFKDAAGVSDIRLIFKDYCRKSPTSWQQIAQISDWWCKNKKPYPLHTKYYASTCTEHNEDLLNMAQADQLQDLVYLKYLLQKNGSPAARKVYEYHFSKFFKANMSEFEAKK